MLYWQGNAFDDTMIPNITRLYQESEIPEGGAEP